MHLSHLPTSLKIMSECRPNCCTHALLREVISTSSLLWSQQPPKSCSSGPNKLVGCCTYYKCCLLPKHKMLFNTDVADSETSHFEHPLYMHMVKKTNGEVSIHIFATYTFEVPEEQVFFFRRVTSDDVVLFSESAG
jgi:hypothetical protein